MSDENINEKRLLYPRVSNILSIQNASALRAMPIDKMVQASLRGTAVHNYCTVFLKKLFLPEIEIQYLPYVEAFALWANENIRNVISVSKRLYDDDLRFSGEFDAIVTLKDCDAPTLIDIKATCLPSKTWPIQLAAYRYLCQKNDIPIERIMNIHLKKKVKQKTQEIQGEKVRVSIPVVCAEIIQHENITQAWEIFSSALKCYDYFERKEEKNDVACTSS